MGYQSGKGTIEAPIVNSIDFLDVLYVCAPFFRDYRHPLYLSFFSYRLLINNGLAYITLSSEHDLSLF